MSSKCAVGSVVGGGLLLMVLIFISPIFSIWALNVLFNLSIPITLKTYLSACWLGGLVYGKAK